MRNSYILIVVALFFMGLVGLSGCDTATQTDSRDYIIQITNSDALAIDSIVITRKMGTVVDTLKFVAEDFEGTTENITVSFQVASDENLEIAVSYVCYSYGIPVIEKVSTFLISETPHSSGGGPNLLAVELLKNFQVLLANVTDTSSAAEKRLFDSLFVEYTLGVEDSLARGLYTTYIQKPDIDTAYFLTILSDTLRGRGHDVPQWTLSERLGIKRLEIVAFLDMYSDTVTIFAGVSSSAVVIAEVSSSTIVESSMAINTIVSSQSLSTPSSTVVQQMSSVGQVMSSSMLVSSSELLSSSSVQLVSSSSVQQSPSSTQLSSSSSTLSSVSSSSQLPSSSSTLSSVSSSSQLLSSSSSQTPLSSSSQIPLSSSLSNTAPNSDDQAFSIDENATGLLGTISAVDAENDALTFSLTSSHAGLFSIGAASGTIQVVSNLDYETSTSHLLTIRISDGVDFIDITVTVTVLPVNDNLPEIVNSGSIVHSLDEDVNAQFNLSATDLDGGSFSWRIISSPSFATVTINTLTGTVSYFLSSNQFGTGELIVEVTDAGGLTNTTVISVEVTSVDDPLVYSSDPILSGTEQFGGTAVVDANGTCSDDDDASVIFTYQWYRGGSNISDVGTAITGATTTAYSFGALDLGKYIYAAVTCPGAVDGTQLEYTDKIYYLNAVVADGVTGQDPDNTYDIVYIGSQVWMAENLKLSRSMTGGSLQSFCPAGDNANCAIYGRLYYWIDGTDGEGSSTSTPSGVQGLCPNGWSIPSPAQFQTLSAYILEQQGSGAEIGTILKSTTGWNSGNGTDLYGFNALPAGAKYTFAPDAYQNPGSATGFMTSELIGGTSNGQTVHVSISAGISMFADNPNGRSIRCIKNP